MPFCMPKLMKPGFLLRTFFGIMTQPLHRIASHFQCFLILSDVLFPAHLGFHVCETLEDAATAYPSTAQWSGSQIYRFRKQLTLCEDEIFQVLNQIMPSKKWAPFLLPAVKERPHFPSSLERSQEKPARWDGGRKEAPNLREQRFLSPAHHTCKSERWGSQPLTTVRGFPLIRFTTTLLGWRIRSTDGHRWNNITTSPHTLHQADMWLK